MHVPAILRAKIIETCRPELTAKAWYQAWKGVPDLPLLQDAMLRCWLESGATDSVRGLGPAFLPARCRAGTQPDLLAILRQAGVATLGACWKAGDAIEAMLFGASARMRLLLSDETRQYQFEVPADGRRFRLPLPRPTGVWSLAFADSEGQPQLLQGSPLVFAPPHRVVPVQTGTQVAVAVSAPAQARPVDIVIPVYGDAPRTRACIESVLTSLRHNTTPAALLVVDDASPEPELSAWLDTQAANGRLHLLRNPRNLGFIETCNRAMREHPERDIMLLNADTLVHGDWLDRLRATLYSAPDIATATPWTNNGEISSFPKIATNARGPNPAQLARLDGTAAALRQSGRTEDLELPTCCGFAMLIKRSVLDEIGLLDGVHLVRGYGEEVDWCLRASATGHRHLLSTGVFIAHTGTVSFRFEKTLRVRENRAVLAARYPRYHADYARFLSDDPLLEARTALRDALEEQRCDWLTAAVQLLEGAAEVARPVPQALPSSCMRIGVWQHRQHHPHSSKVLSLARLIASRPELSMRLLVIGEASEALWHTGVVDVLQSGIWDETTLLTDAALVGMTGCAALLVQHTLTTPLGVPRTELDESFDPEVWLNNWLAQHKAPPPARKKRQSKLKEAAAA
ncbi:glycosyltransferase family 2 protein [Pseudoduganella namucuonensis]|nr:glycosyltransferase [Pseudoduganella namucuonensis]